MQTLTLKYKIPLILLGALAMTGNTAMARSDKEIMGDVQKARELNRDHSQHVMPVKFSESKKFRGVFYGYLPCDTCAGIKMILSLKNKNNYLLVTQYAQSSNREYFDKGKYTWNDKTQIVTLTARKGSKVTTLLIKDEGHLIVLSPEGNAMSGNQDQYTLVRSDKNKAREVHIH